MSTHPAPLVLLTGERGIGKTTVCSVLRDLVTARGCRCGGFFTRRDLDSSGATRGLFLEEAGGGARHRLAATREDLGGPRIGPFSMDAAVLAWGTDLVRGALANRLGLVFVDEIGPLELVQGLGFAPVIPLVAEQSRTPVIVVVRPALVDTAVQSLVPRIARLETVTLGNRDLLPQLLGGAIPSAELH
jgi:nucleoside-triphosphatase THEP1